MPHINRPLSPHLSIYRPQMTTVLSIIHRITGVALYVGMALLAAFLFILAYSNENFDLFHSYAASPIGLILLIGWTFAFFFHFYNGIRHLFWDIGKGLTIPTSTKTGILVLIATLASTGAVWCYACQQGAPL